MLIKYEFRDAIHTHFVTLIGKWTISFLPTHQVFLSSLLRDVTKILYFNLADFITLIGPILDPPTHNRPFADKRDKMGMDGVPKRLSVLHRVELYMVGL